jgi:hypothetical protein
VAPGRRRPVTAWPCVVCLLVALLLTAAPGAPVTGPGLAIAGDEPARSTLFASSPEVPGWLPAAPAGEVAIVARSPVLGDGSRVVAVVRNGTDRTVTGIGVAVIRRAMSAGSDTAPAAMPGSTPGPSDATPVTPSDARPVAPADMSPVGPLTIPPGGLALARVVLDPPLAPGEDVDLSVVTGVDVSARMDLAIPFGTVTGDELAGSVTAIDVDAAWDPEVLAVCVAPDGTVSDYAWSALQPTRIDPYRSIPLRLPLPADCDAVLAAATARR